MASWCVEVLEGLHCGTYMLSVQIYDMACKGHSSHTRGLHLCLHLALHDGHGPACHPDYQIAMTETGQYVACLVVLSSGP